MKCLKCGNNLELYKNNVLVCTYCYARFKVSDKQLEKHKSENFSAVDFSKPRPNCVVVNPLEENKNLIKNKDTLSNFNVEEKVENKFEEKVENNSSIKNDFIEDKIEEKIVNNDTFEEINIKPKKHKNKILLLLITLLVFISLGLVLLII